MSFANKNILITGGAGFIGSNLAIALQNKFPECQIVVFDKFRGDRLSNGNLSSLGHDKNLVGFHGEVIRGDITSKSDIKTLKEQYKFDVIYHFAAISDTTTKEKEIVLKTNATSFHDIIDVALCHNAKLIYASSAAVYGSLKAPQKVGEEAPLNTYGDSKLKMDILAAKQYKNIDSIIGLRFFNVYGEREFFKGKTASTILQFGLQFLQGEVPKLFIGSENIYRDFIYIKDVLDCCILAGESNISGIYNVGTGISRSFKEVFDLVGTTLDVDIPPNYIENKFTEHYQFFTQADISETQKDLKFYPKYTLEKGIKEYSSSIKQIYSDEF